MNEEKKDSEPSTIESLCNEDIDQLVVILVNEIETNIRDDKRVNLTSHLKKSRDDVLSKIKSSNQKLNSRRKFPLLPSFSERFVVSSNVAIGPYQHKIKISAASNRFIAHQINKPITIESSTQKRPEGRSIVFLKKNSKVEDQMELEYAPYFGEEIEDEDEHNRMSEIFDISKRQRYLDLGAEHEQDRLNVLMDYVFQKVTKRLSSSMRGNRDGPTYENVMARVMEKIADLREIDVKYVQSRFEFIRNIHSLKTQISPNMTPIKNSGIESRGNREYEYNDINDSYKNLFCKRCFQYDCHTHGLQKQVHNELQIMLAVDKQTNDSWQDHGLLPPNTNDDNSEANDKKLSTSERSPTIKEKAIIRHAFKVFQGDKKAISSVLDTSRRNVELLAKSKNILFTTNEENLLCQFIGANSNKATSRKKSKKRKNSRVKAPDAWLAKKQKPHFRDGYIPCDHEGECAEENCDCVQNLQFCTKACLWGSRSAYFFPGCECKKGECSSNACCCFVAQRECDPDLCLECGTCQDEPNKPATKQKCRNDNVTMRRHCQLLVAKSSVEGAGWGIYNKNSLKKDEFIHEYLGEYISQQEGERRGCIYDRKNSSYLFNLTADFAVDASKKGNKTRFINDSKDNPNCRTRIMFVNGDARIGIYANEDIEPQTELFFDYLYDQKVNNDLILLPGKNFAWQKNRENKKAKKKNSQKNAEKSS